MILFGFIVLYAPAQVQTYMFSSVQVSATNTHTQNAFFMLSCTLLLFFFYNFWFGGDVQNDEYYINSTSGVTLDQ